MNVLRIGTRGSPLALAQANLVKGLLTGQAPDLQVQLKVIRTHGDEAQREGFTDLSGKALFTHRIEEALLEGHIEVAVHSLKDLPASSLGGVVLASVPRREDPRDALVTPDGRRLLDLPRGARLGTSSLRRQAQLLAQRPDLAIDPLRGNVETRLRKMRESGWHGIVLAAAGLQRLGLASTITERLDPHVVLPAPGQGALAIQARDDAPHLDLVRRLDDPDTRAAVEAERSFARSLDADCNVPVAALAEVHEDRLRLRGRILHPRGARATSGEIQGPVTDAERLGQRLSERLLNDGGRELLQVLR